MAEKIRKPFSRVGVVQDVGEETMTKQSFKQECDINHIMGKYRRTGLVEHVNRFQGQYGDISGICSYQDAIQIGMDAQDMFMSLPADIRKRFDNDPGSFLAFATDQENHDEMVELGLVPKPPSDVPAPADPPPDPAPAPEG